MSVDENRSGFLLPAASFVVIVAGLRAADTIVIPFLIALFVSILSLPFLFWMQHQGVPRPLAALVTVITATGVLTVAGGLIAGAVTEFAVHVPEYRRGLQGAVNESVAWLQARGVDLEASDLFDPNQIVDLARGTMARVAALLQHTILVLLITIFILFEAAGFPAKLRAALGKRAQRNLLEVTGEVQSYLVVKTIMSLLVGLAVGVLTWGVGLDYPIFWGMLSFLMHYIPNIGALLGAAPAVLLSLVQLGAGRAATLVGGYAVVHLTLGILVERRVLGRGPGLSTLVVFLSLLFWGWVWGPVGMLLSVPLTIIVKILLQNSKQWRWLAVILGPAQRPGSPRTELSTS